MKYLISILIAMFFATNTLAGELVIEMLNKRKSDNASMVYSEDISKILSLIHI